MSSVNDAADMLIAAAQKGCVQRGLDPTALRQQHLTFHHLYPQVVDEGRLKFILRVTHPDAERPFDLEVSIQKENA